MYESNDIVPTQSSAIAVASKKNALQRCLYTDQNGVACRGEYCELSVYSNRPALHTEVVAECATLLAAFPEQNPAFYSILHKAVEDEGMSLERLREAVRRLITEHRYRTFSVADVVGYDKTIRVARSISTLRYITRTPKLDYSDIVVVRGKVEDNECKMFGVKCEIETSPYKSRIIGTWNSDTNSWNILGQVNDSTIPQRQEFFKQSLYEYCNRPPRYNGKYDAEMVKAFYDYYSQIVGFGDVLRFEQQMQWNAESALEVWKTRCEQAQKQTEPTNEETEEITDEMAKQQAQVLQAMAEDISTAHSIQSKHN